MFRVVAVLTVVLMAAGLSGCGASAKEKQEQRHSFVHGLNSQDPYEVLNGRSAETVLRKALSQASCTWLEKGLISASENRLVMTNFSYDADKKLLTLHQYSEYDWSPWEVHRTTSDVIIPVSGLSVRIDPPYVLDSTKCWNVDLGCQEDQCIEYDQRYQLRGSGSVTDKGSKSSTTKFWTLFFDGREPAVEAWAALEVLAK